MSTLNINEKTTVPLFKVFVFLALLGGGLQALFPVAVAMVEDHKEVKKIPRLERTLIRMDEKLNRLELNAGTRTKQEIENERKIDSLEERHVEEDN